MYKSLEQFLNNCIWVFQAFFAARIIHGCPLGFLCVSWNLGAEVVVIHGVYPVKRMLDSK